MGGEKITHKWPVDPIGPVVRLIGLTGWSVEDIFRPDGLFPPWRDDLMGLGFQTFQQIRVDDRNGAVAGLVFQAIH